MKHKVILYNPRSVFHTMPLGLLAIGSNLPADHYQTVIIDGRLEQNPVAAVLSNLDGALCLGISVLTGSPIRDALRVTEAAKARRPDLPIIWGGWHPSLFPTDCLAEACIDVTVQAQGEVTFRELVDRLAAGAALDDVAGIALRAAGHVTQNAPRSLAAMDTLAGHRYDLIAVERYFSLKRERQLDYVSSTGCFFRCAFCADPYVFKRKWTALSPKRVGEEIAWLWHRYRFTDLAFQDETFFTYRDRVEEIAEEFLRRGLQFTWTGTLRADQGVRLSEKALCLCKRSGLRRVMIGVESGSQEMLDWMNKDITIEQVLSTAEMCARLGIGAIFPFIVGFPEESDESIDETFRVAKKLRRMSPDFETVIFFYQPYPGSPIADLVKEKQYPMPQTLKEWADFDYIGSHGPWVRRGLWRQVQRFSFYNRLAWSANGGLARASLKRLARWRCEHDLYFFPFEKALVEAFRPPRPLS